MYTFSTPCKEHWDTQIALQYDFANFKGQHAPDQGSITLRHTRAGHGRPGLRPNRSSFNPKALLGNADIGQEHED